jgi:cytochrome c-type biogenesis protein CcmE
MNFRELLNEGKLDEGKPFIVTPKHLSRDGDEIKFTASDGIIDVIINFDGRWFTLYKNDKFKKMVGNLKALNKYINNTGILYAHKLVENFNEATSDKEIFQKNIKKVQS